MNQADHGIVNFDAVIDGSVYRGGQPNSPDSWTFLKSMGIRTVVKLNYPKEGVDDGAVAAGLQVIDCRMPPEDFWQAVGRPQPQEVAAAVNALRSESNWPVYVHCLHGQDRTGLVIGEFRVLKQGWTTDQAYAEMLEYGFHPIPVSYTHLTLPTICSV